MKKILLVIVMSLLFSTLIFAGEKKDTADTGSYRFVATLDWSIDQGRVDFDDAPNDPYFQYVEKTLGIVPQAYCYDWDGGVGYQQAVRLLLASGVIPEVILNPFDTAFVRELYDLGLLIPLDDYLDHCPDVMAMFTEEEMDIIRGITPDGKIYYIPSKGVEPRQGMIRKDWLEAVGMDVPTTRDELVAVYRAFKEQDANGNGDPNDEIPVSGREGMRWADDLYVMHGVAMYEGHPEMSWDPVKQKMVSHQASENMHQSLLFIRSLIDEGLMDQVYPIQPASDWFAKLAADKVGHYFHLADGIERRLTMRESGENPDAEWIYLPNVAVPGLPHQKNFYPGMSVPQIVITTEAKDPGKILEWLNWGMSEEGTKFSRFGIEGVNYKVGADGKFVSEGFPAIPRRTFSWLMTGKSASDYRQTHYGEMKAAIYEASINDGRALDNLGMPSTVYEDYDAYKPNNMGSTYRQYASKFILGELPLDSWDDYVKDWRANGGDVIEQRATEWYKKVHNIK